MNHKGFSLIEVLIAMAIFGILLTALTAFFISQNRQYVVQSEIVAMQDNARAAMDFVVRTLRNSEESGPYVYDTHACDHVLIVWLDNENDERKAHKFGIYHTGGDGANTFGYQKYDDEEPSTIDEENIKSGLTPFALNITCFEVVDLGENDNNLKNQFKIKITAETERILPGIGQEGSVTLESTVKPRNLN